MRALAASALATLVLAGCLAPAADVGLESAPPQLPDGRPAVVIAVVDTGINLYHAEYRRGGAADAAMAAATEDALPAQIGALARLPVNVSLSIAEWEKAVEADKEALMTMEPETLYAFPGTKIVGAISFQQRGQDWPLILDRPGGHGTMTTSRAVGNTVSIPGADADVHLVMIQGFTPEALRWAADQEWIDIVSISAGLSFLPIAPGVANAGEAAGLSDAVSAYNYLAHRKPFFASTGNGVANAGLLGFPSWLRGASGVPNVLSVGANNNDEYSHWHNQDPYISADGCDNPSADSDDTESVSNYGGGTSSATPFSAGGGAKLLLEARRILGDLEVGARIDTELAAPEGAWDSGRAEDHQVVLAKGAPGLVAEGPLADGVFTLAEFKQAMYTTALPHPQQDDSDGDKCAPTGAGGFPGGERLPLPARFILHGYGEVNHASIEAALAVLRGEVKMPDRPDDDEQYILAHHRKVAVVGDEE